jgi:glycosyltransferase involved in cell wall biosynthesis
MNANRRVLFYSDAPEFGGHETLTVEAADYLRHKTGLRVSFAYYQANERLSQRLKDIQNATGNLRLLPMPFKSKSLQAVRTLINWRQIRRIEALIKSDEPDLVVVSQGRIEGGSAGLLAAKRLGIQTISYIPMAHSVSVSGKPIAVGLRDALNKYFYQLPDKYITSSNGARDMLVARGAKADIAVVPNGIEPITIQESDRKRFREEHGIMERDYVVAVVGRIDFRQKCQDFALQSIAQFRRELRDWKFLFIGSGPDEEKLKRIIVDLDLGQQAMLLPWSPSRAQFYAGIDILLIPSRFEGVPLVMGEAMSCGLRIVASDVDAMTENLPKSWLFPYGNSKAMVDTLIRVRSDDVSALLESNRRRVTEENNVVKFGCRFANAILS